MSFVEGGKYKLCDCGEESKPVKDGNKFEETELEFWDSDA